MKSRSWRKENQSSERERESVSRWTLGNRWKWPGTLIVAVTGGEGTGKKCRSRSRKLPSKTVREGAGVVWCGWKGSPGWWRRGRIGLQKGESAK